MVRSSGFGSTICYYTRPFQTRFRFGSATSSLNLATHRNSPARSTKSTRSHGQDFSRRFAPSACKHTVSGSLSLPSRGAFHLSLTVLYSIGHQVVFSLRRWASRIPTEFLVFDGTLDTHGSLCISATGLLPCFVAVSTRLRLCSEIPCVSPNPAHISICGLGSYPFARHYLGNRCFTFSSSGY